MQSCRRRLWKEWTLSSEASKADDRYSDVEVWRDRALEA